MRPAFDVASSWVAQEGRVTTTTLRASDPDDDPITFHVQAPGEAFGALGRIGFVVLRDHGDGTADLDLAPRYNEAGTYKLRMAAFDEAGAVTIRDVPLIVEDTQREGDANCDGRLGPDDVEPLLEALFDHRLANACVTVDGNGDGRANAADLTALFAKLNL